MSGGGIGTIIDLAPRASSILFLQYYSHHRDLQGMCGLAQYSSLMADGAPCGPWSCMADWSLIRLGMARANLGVRGYFAFFKRVVASMVAFLIRLDCGCDSMGH